MWRKTIFLLCIGRRELSLWGRSQLIHILIHLSADQVGHFSPTEEYIKIDSGGEIEAKALESERIEEVFEDRNIEFFDTFSTYGSINQLKSKLKTFEDQGTNLHGVCRFQFHFCVLNKPLIFHSLLSGMHRTILILNIEFQIGYSEEVISDFILDI